MGSSKRVYRFCKVIFMPDDKLEITNDSDDWGIIRYDGVSWYVIDTDDISAVGTIMTTDISAASECNEDCLDSLTEGSANTLEFPLIGADSADQILTYNDADNMLGWTVINPCTNQLQPKGGQPMNPYSASFILATVVITIFTVKFIIPRCNIRWVVKKIFHLFYKPAKSAIDEAEDEWKQQE